jgi:Ras-related protein Rab-18
MLFIECSAKTKEGVQQTFEELANKILDTPSLLGNTAPMGMNLNKTAADSGSSGCAC